MLTIGTPWKVLLKFALPLMLANILQQLYNTADTIILGNFDSQNSLAAVGSCTYIAGLYTGVSVALALGVGIIVSQFYGAKDEDAFRKSADTGSLLLLFLGLVISVFSYFTSESVLIHIIKVPPEIFDKAVIYAKIYSVSLFFQFGYNAFASILRAIGNSKSSFWFLLITTVVNIVLDLIFVCKLHLGVTGVAIATYISQFLAMAISYFYMINKYPILKPSWHYDQSLVNKCLKTGIPLMVQSLIVNLGFMIMQNIANSFGVQMTASYAVSCRLEIYMLVPIFSILHSMSTFAGQNYGANKITRLHTGVKQAVIMNLAIAFLIGSFCFIFAPQLISLFAIKGQAFQYALSHVKLASADLLLYALYSPISGLCIGVGKGYILSVISFVELSSRIIFSLILSSIIGAGCLWWSEPFAWIIVIIGVYLYYNKYLKKYLKEITI